MRAIFLAVAAILSFGFISAHAQQADDGRLPLQVAGPLRKQTSDVLLLDVRSLGRRIGAFDPERTSAALNSPPRSGRSDPNRGPREEAPRAWRGDARPPSEESPPITYQVIRQAMGERAIVCCRM